MKLKVISAFHDKYNDELYEIGKELAVDEKRGKELLSNPLSLVELVEEGQDKPKPKTRKTTRK